MTENNKSKSKNFDTGVIIDKISKAAAELSNTTNPLNFIEQMISISVLLIEYDPPLSDIIRTIDEKAQDPSYFIAAYFDTKDIAKALWIYRVVRLLAKYILLSDRFYEIGNDSYALLAERVRESVNEYLRSESDTQHLSYSIPYSLEQFSTFWKFEQIVKSRILGNYAFSYAEIRHFNLSKSSDASIVYAKVLDAKLPSFNENVALVLHYNQALLDIHDDWEDIADDVQEDMPNIFVMAALENIPYNIIKNSSHEMIREVVLNGADISSAQVIRLVNDIEASVRNVSIPDIFGFLKSLSDRYADTLRKTISVAYSQ
ncbi:MAG: hypothetical protein WAL66_07235 [Nitrososphaeraceae archaeon]